MKLGIVADEISRDFVTGRAPLCDGLFLEAARDGLPAPVSIASGVHDMRVVAALYESARNRRSVEVA